MKQFHLCARRNFVAMSIVIGGLAVTSYAQASTVFTTNCFANFSVWNPPCGSPQFVALGELATLTFPGTVPLNGTTFNSPATLNISMKGQTKTVNLPSAAYYYGQIPGSWIPPGLVPLTANGAPMSGPVEYDFSGSYFSSSGYGMFFSIIPQFFIRDFPHGVDSLVGVQFQPGSPHPTALQLAEMAQQTYSVGPPAAIDTFTPIERVARPAGFGADVYRAGDTIVVAIRGTNQKNERDNLKNSEADYSFTSHTATQELSTEVDDAVALITTLQEGCPTCEFYLTGHSLGGAIAQVLNTATGLPTLAFDAPGAGGTVLDQLQGNLSGLKGISFANSGSNVNLRMYGDLISQVGTPLGSQVTIDSFHNAIADTSSLLTWQKDHSIGEMVHALANGNNTALGVLGPTLSSVEDAFGSAHFAHKHAEFDLAVRKGEITPLDPVGAEYYQLIETAGSPFISSIGLPFEESVSSYGLSFLHDGAWSPDLSILPGAFYNFGPDVIGLSFWSLDGYGHVVAMPDQFFFYLTFSDDGRFRGTLTVRGVSESPTWPTFAGMCLFLISTGVFRRKNNP